MRKARGITDREARAVVNRWKQANSQFDKIGRGMARSIVAPLSGVAGVLTVREVLRYADAWTRAKNSLAIAGVQGANQKRVLDQLYQSAQANAAPIEALTGLYGKAAQAGDVLGATQEQLIEFSDGVAVALKVAGTGATEARGALTQLGQLLGSTRVQAEEFNSVNEGARPILQAVANGLDKAGGSVSKLKQLVNDGEVSGREFFNAFLKGLPQLRAQAAGAAQTIEQGYTKINNALTRYIGQTDSSLGASQRLVQGLNAFADDFDHIADLTLKVAAVIAGALVGRSLVGLIAKLTIGAAALARFARALAVVRTVASVSTAISGMGVAAGPVGLAIGTVLTGALIAFGTQSGEASDAAQAYAQALREIEKAAEAAAKSTLAAAETENRQKREADAIAGGIEEGKNRIAAARKEISDLLDFALRNIEVGGADGLTEDQFSAFRFLVQQFQNGSTEAAGLLEQLYEIANTDSRWQRLADAVKPFVTQLQNAQAATTKLVDDQRLLRWSSIPQDPGIAGRRMQMEENTRTRFWDQQEQDARRSSFDKEVEAKAKTLMEAAQKMGVAMRITGTVQTSAYVDTPVARSDLVEWADAFERLDGVSGETPFSALGNRVVTSGAYASTEVFVLATVGVGGTGYAQFKKGTTPYKNLLATIKRDWIMAQLLGLTMEVSLDVFFGQNDRGAAAGVVKGYLVEWQADITADVQAIIPGHGEVVIFVSSLANWTAPTYADTFSFVPGDIAQAARENPTKIVYAGSEYIIPTASDGVHFTNVGSCMAGDMHAGARIRHKAGQPSCFGAVSAVRSGDTITLTCGVPVGPIVRDAVTVTPPDGDPGIVAGVVDGFRYHNPSSPADISNIAISGSTLVITLASDPGGAISPDERLFIGCDGAAGAPGGPTTGPRVCYRDSDPGTHLHGSRQNWLAADIITPTT